MGFFSKCCAKSQLPVVHDGRGYPELNEVIVLYPDGKKIEGSYDGYGRVDGVDLCPGGYDHQLWTKLKFVLKSKYAGESYKELGRSYDEAAQGHFMADDFLDYCLEVGSFASHREYQKAFKELAAW